MAQESRERELAVAMWDVYAEKFAPKREWVRKTVRKLLRLYKDMGVWLIVYHDLEEVLESKLKNDQILNELKTAAQIIESMRSDIKQIANRLTEEL